MTKPNIKDSLQIRNPALANEWHVEKNESLTPADVTPFSNKKVWWQCPKGHEWPAVISNRSNGQGCPYCAGQKVNRENCLRAVKPNLADEWHSRKNGDLTPDDVTPFSNKRIWWRCARGHEWSTKVYNRSNGHGCPRCYKEGWKRF
jgi:hypothetical protein